jgi:hypothetical protein
MNIAEISSQIANAITNFDIPNSKKFDILRDVCNLYNEVGYDKNFQKVFFTLLENREHFEIYGEIIDCLIRDIGLFPYIDENNVSNFRDMLAINAFVSPSIRSTKTIFHYPQAKVFHTILSGNSVILSAPTSFGKSLIIDAIIATKKFKNIVIIVPTVALIDETRKRLSSFSENYKIITHHSQSKGLKNIYILTQERAIIDNFIDHIDFFVIDEFYKLNPSQKEDSRCDMLNLAFYKLYKKCRHFYMLGPNIDGLVKQVEGSISYVFIREEFPTVGTNIYNLEEEVTTEKIYELYSSFKDSTLIYSNTPKSVTDLAISLLELKPVVKINSYITALCSWLENTYHKDWSLIKCLQHGIGYHHARLPRAVAQLIVELFNTKILDILICTSTIIEGVNTSAKNVIMHEQKIGLNNLDFFTFNNVAGRAGRMFKHFRGNVFIFSDPPQPILPHVDIPALSQSKDTSVNILLGMDPEDLKQESQEKISKYIENEKDLSVETIRKNPHVDPEMQIALAKHIKGNARNFHSLLNWSSNPTYDQLKFSCELMFKFFNAEKLASYTVKSAKHLCFLINRLRFKPTVKEIIIADIENARNKNFTVDVDYFIANHLSFTRMWANYHFPRLLMTISSIQSEVFGSLGMSNGDYSFFAFSVESLFFDPALICLEEYGIPIELSRKLDRQLSHDGDLDRTLDTLKHLDTKGLPLSPPEKMFLRRAIRYI